MAISSLIWINTGCRPLAAAVVKDGCNVAAGAVGYQAGRDEHPGRDRRPLHIGSDAKAMTALLAAMLVEEGKLRWDRRSRKSPPARAAQVGDSASSQLPSHTSGIPSDNDAQDKLGGSTGQTELNLDEMRYRIVERLVAMPLRSRPRAFAYANSGYVLAGAIVERLYRSTWEQLVATRIFDRSGCRRPGFGAQATLGHIDAPLWHRPLPPAR